MKFFTIAALFLGLSAFGNPQVPNLTPEQRKMIKAVEGTKCFYQKGNTSARRMHITGGKMIFTDKTRTPIMVFALKGRSGLMGLVGQRIQAPYGHKYVSMKLGLGRVHFKIGGGLKNQRRVYNVAQDFQMKCTHPRLNRRR